MKLIAVTAVDVGKLNLVLCLKEIIFVSPSLHLLTDKSYRKNYESVNDRKTIYPNQSHETYTSTT